jgi:hypothetical protein
VRKKLTEAAQPVQVNYVNSNFPWRELDLPLDVSMFAALGNEVLDLRETFLFVVRKP